MRATLFRLYFQGPLKALPRAPTLLGHLFWWYRYTHGREALEELLERFRQEPPFRLSSVYPEGWLPRPKLPPVQVEETTLRKALKSLSLVRLDTFQALAERGRRPSSRPPRSRERPGPRRCGGSAAPGWGWTGPRARPAPASSSPRSTFSPTPGPPMPFTSWGRPP